MEFHRSAFKHGYSTGDVEHAVEHALVIADLDPEADPPKVLAVGPDLSGSLIEVIWLELATNVELVIHAMQLRAVFFELLPTAEDPTP